MQESIRTEIGKRISAALDARNMRQKDLAHAIGVKDNVVSFFCSGARVPNAEQIIGISKYLNVSSDYLLGLTANMTTDKDLDSACSYTKLGEAAVQMLHDGVTGELKDWFINEFFDLIANFDYSKALFRNLFLYLNSTYTTLINIPKEYGILDLNYLSLDEFRQNCKPIKQLISVHGDPEGDFDYVGSHMVDDDVLQGLFLMSAIKDLNRIKEEYIKNNK